MVLRNQDRMNLGIPTDTYEWENRSSWTSPLGPVGCPFHGDHRKSDLNHTYEWPLDVKKQAQQQQL